MLGEYGICHQIRTVISFLYCANVFPCIVYDEVCRRSINFQCTCVSHNSKVARCVANYGIFHGRCDSAAGRNALHCINRYSATLSGVLSLRFESLVWEHATKDIFYSVGTIG